MSANNVTLADLKAALAGRAEAFCREFLPEGRRVGGYWTAGSVQGERGRSLVVRLAGSRAGSWRDYATGEGGSLIDLIAIRSGVRFAVAAARAVDWLGGGSMLAGTPVEPGPDADEERRIRLAREIWDASLSVAGPAEAYLRRRGLTNFPPALRFHPALELGGRRWPALVAAVTTSDGVLCGIHRTFLRPDGTKADIERPKRALGRLVVGAVHLSAAAPKLGIAEGIETALSAAQLFGLPVWAMVGTAGILRPALPREVVEVVIFADGDRPGCDAAERAALYLRESGRSARIAWAPAGQDFNDVLLARGGGQVPLVAGG